MVFGGRGVVGEISAWDGEEIRRVRRMRNIEDPMKVKGLEAMA